MAKSFALLFAFTFFGTTFARTLFGTPSCATGAKYEVLKFDNYARSFHSLSGIAFNVKTIADCAKLCLKASDCACAYFPGDGSCQWRTDSCEHSELYVSKTPVTAAVGLITVCPVATVKPGKAPFNDKLNQEKERVERYAPCAGVNHKGSKCCRAGDRCVQKNKWYSQCRPVSSPIPDGWSGKIIKAPGC